uniref:(northern house mosquito) hypothetical protein n=1 Tax=Culex pipiens TaxID=7175 RepID=A0A8D8BJM0_CULPI
MNRSTIVRGRPRTAQPRNDSVLYFISSALLPATEPAAAHSHCQFISKACADNLSLATGDVNGVWREKMKELIINTHLCHPFSTNPQSIVLFPLLSANYVGIVRGNSSRNSSAQGNILNYCFHRRSLRPWFDVGGRKITRNYRRKKTLCSGSFYDCIILCPSSCDNCSRVKWIAV